MAQVSPEPQPRARVASDEPPVIVSGARSPSVRYKPNKAGGEGEQAAAAASPSQGAAKAPMPKKLAPLGSSAAGASP